MKVAHVPVVYQVPPLMMQPFVLPPDVTGSVPRPEKGLPGVEVEVGEVVLVLVGGGLVPPDPLGRYLTPVAGQEDLDPSRHTYKYRTTERAKRQCSHLDRRR